MNNRKISIILLIVVAFLAGYFNYYLAPYFLSTNFALGFVSASLTLALIYIFHLKDKLKQRNRELYDDRYELRNSVNEILQKLNKKK